MSNSLRISKVLASVMVTGLLAVAVGAASAAQPQAAQPKVSQANRENFKLADEAFKAKRYSEVVAKANAALANPERTRDDVFAAHSFLYNAASAQNDNAGMMKAIEGQIESGFLSPAGVNQAYRNLLGMSYQQKDYRNAINYGQQLIKAGDTSPDVYQWVGQGYYELKEFNEAVRFFNNLVTEKEKRGQRPDRNELILLQSSYDKAGNKDAAQATLEKVIKFYPDAGTWALLQHDVKREKLDPRQKLHLYRLMELTGNLKQGPDYMAFSDAAMTAGLQAESRRVLESGIKTNALTGDARVRAERYIKSAAARAEAMRAELPKMEANAKSAPTGDQYVSLGMAYYSFGDYAKAVTALQAGIAKGGLKNPADARTALGVAQIKAGQKGEALKTFRAAKPDDAVTRRIVQLWALYAS